MSDLCCHGSNNREDYMETYARQYTRVSSLSLDACQEKSYKNVDLKR